MQIQNSEIMNLLRDSTNIVLSKWAASKTDFNNVSYGGSNASFKNLGSIA